MIKKSLLGKWVVGKKLLFLWILFLEEKLVLAYHGTGTTGGGSSTSPMVVFFVLMGVVVFLALLIWLLRKMS